VVVVFADPPKPVVTPERMLVEGRSRGENKKEIQTINGGAAFEFFPKTFAACRNPVRDPCQPAYFGPNKVSNFIRSMLMASKSLLT